MPEVAGQMEEENMEAVIAAAAERGIQWEDLTTEQKATLYRDYTGEEMSIQRMEDFIDARSGGTMAGNVFVADSMGEGLASLGASYQAKKKRDELSAQKAQAYELAGGLGAGALQEGRDHQMALANALNGKVAQASQQGGGQQGGNPGAPQGGQPANPNMPPMASAGAMGGPPGAPQAPQAPQAPPAPPQPKLNRITGMPIGGGMPPQASGPGAMPAPGGGQVEGVTNSPLWEKLKMEEMIKRLRGR